MTSLPVDQARSFTRTQVQVKKVVHGLYYEPSIYRS